MHKLFISLPALFIEIYVTTLLEMNALATSTKNKLLSDFNIINQLNMNIEHFFSVIGIISGCIAVTLIYVSWKKYRGEKTKKKKRRLK